MALEFDTTNLLRPNQLEDAKDEMVRLDEMVNAPQHIRNRISDMPELRRRFKNLKTEMDKATPRAFAPTERDAAIREFAALTDRIRIGMPSSEEMRRNPPGAVGKNREWQQRTKKDVARYKHLALRLQAGGDLPLHIKRSGDCANIELLRPLTTSQQLAMDGAQIPKRTDFHFGEDIANTTVFSDNDIDLVNAIDPEIAAALSVMSQEQREQIKRIIAGVAQPKAKQAKPTKGKKGRVQSSWNETQRLAKKNGIKAFGRPKADVLADLAARGIAA